MVGDDELRDDVRTDREPVVELGDAAREGPLEPQGHHPVVIVDASGADPLGRVLELGAGVPQEGVNLLPAAEGLPLIDGDRVLGEERLRGC